MADEHVGEGQRAEPGAQDAGVAWRAEGSDCAAPEATQDAPPRAPVPEPPRARLAALLEVIACSGFPTQLAIAGLLTAAGITPFDHSGRLSTSYVFILSLADAVALVGLAAWFLRLHGESVRAVLFGRRPLLPEGLLGILHIPLIFLIVVAVMVALHQLAPSMHNVARNPMEGLIRSRGGAVLFVVVAVVGGGVREEVQRAFILHRFDRHLGGGWLGLVLFSVVFGAGHVIQGRDVAVTTAALGFFWGLVYLRRRSIASTVVSHSGFNAAEIVRFAVLGV